MAELKLTRMVSGFSKYKRVDNLRKGNRVAMAKLLVRTNTTEALDCEVYDIRSIFGWSQSVSAILGYKVSMLVLLYGQYSLDKSRTL